MASVIAQNARRIMDEKGIKQKKVAEKAGMTARSLSAMMCGRKIIAADDVVVLARVLEVTPNELFGVVATEGKAG